MKHCIIVKFSESVSSAAKQALIPEIRELFENTKATDGIHEVTLRSNVIDRPNRYDLVIEIDMDPEALSAYDACVWHKQRKDGYGHLLSAKAIIDLD